MDPSPPLDPLPLPTGAPATAPPELPDTSPLDMSTPDRAAMTRDARVILAWLGQSMIWRFLDPVVRFRTGRSLDQIFSSTWSAVMSLPDDELGTLLDGVLARTAGYLGVAPPVEGVDPAERAVVERIVAIVRSPKQ